MVLEGIDLDLDKEKRAYEGLGDFLEVPAFFVSISSRDTGRSHDTFVYTSIYSYIQYHRMSPDRSWTIWERTMVTCDFPSPSFLKSGIVKLWSYSRVARIMAFQT